MEPKNVYETIFDEANIGLAQVGLDGRWLKVNNKLLAITEYQREELLKLTYQDITHIDDIKEEAKEIAAIINGSSKYFHTEKRYITATGKTIWVAVSATLINGPEPYFISSIEDITERRKADEQLINKNKELDSFTAVVAHDLQEPLRSISNIIKSLDKSQYQEHTKSIEIISANINRMRDFVSRLLSYARAGQPTQDAHSNVDIGWALSIAKQNLKSLIEEKQVTIELANTATVKAHPGELIQVIQNLLSNAIKFTAAPRKPIIKINTEKVLNHHIVSITDNGIGIKKQFQTIIFEPFKRLNSKAKYSGAGLGLSICKKILEMRGDTIWVESDGTNGSTFYFITGMVAKELSTDTTV